MRRRPAVGNRIFSIAANTFRETIRNKILYAILAFALFVIGITFFLADLSVGELTRIIVDVGLASIHIFGVVTAVFIGITLISQEVERKTVYLILSKSVPRWEFIVGKAMGLSATLALTTLAMAAMLFLVHLGYERSTEPGIWIASAGIYMELVLLVCLASFFSTFTTPVLSAIFTLSMFLIGHVSGDLLVFGGRAASSTVRWVSTFLYYALPNLENFNWKNEVVYGGVRSPGVLIIAAGYLVCYCAAVLAAACLLFSRKDFK
jgi:ABC-type transport system involved in multi-copper enzyme maturation permease subunit